MISATTDIADTTQPLFVRVEGQEIRLDGGSIPGLRIDVLPTYRDMMRRPRPCRPDRVLRAHHATLLRPRPRRPPRVCGWPTARHSAEETVRVGLVHRRRSGVLDRHGDLWARARFPGRDRGARSGVAPPAHLGLAVRALLTPTRADVATPSCNVPRASAKVDDGVRHGCGERLSELRGGVVAACRACRPACGPAAVICHRAGPVAL